MRSRQPAEVCLRKVPQLADQNTADRRKTESRVAGQGQCRHLSNPKEGSDMDPGDLGSCGGRAGLYRVKRLRHI